MEMRSHTRVFDFMEFEIAVHATHYGHGSGWTIRVEIHDGDGALLSQIRDDDHSYASQDEAEKAGRELAEPICRQLVAGRR